MAEVDSLTIKVEATSATAKTNPRNLVTALDDLKAATSGVAGLNPVVKQLKVLSTAAGSINGDAASNVQQLVSALSGLKTVKTSILGW